MTEKRVDAAEDDIFGGFPDDSVAAPAPGPDAAPDPANLACPAPIPERTRVLLGHGSGGQLSAALMRDVIAPALASAGGGAQGPLNDAAVVDVAGSRLAFTTDSFVVSPLEFPGGDIGELAVFGTVNDLAMMGAQPLALSLAYVIEEGLPIDELRKVTESVARAAARSAPTAIPGATSPMPAVLTKSPSAAPLPTTFVSPVTIRTPARAVARATDSVTLRSSSIGRPSSMT